VQRAQLLLTSSEDGGGRLCRKGNLQWVDVVVVQLIGLSNFLCLFLTRLTLWTPLSGPTQRSGSTVIWTGGGDRYSRHMASGKKEKSMESMKTSIVAKLVMVVKTRPAHTKPSIISTKAMGELVDRLEEAVPGWVKKSAHLEKVRTFQSALQQAKNHDINIKCLTVEEIEKKNVDKNKKKEEKKEKKEEWEELTIVGNQVKCEQIKFNNVNNSSTGIVMTTWNNMRDNFHRIASSLQLCFVVPGHFVKREGDDQLAKMSWRHDDLILAGRSSNPMMKKVTIFDITGKGLPERCGGEKEDEDGVKGDALREVLLRAVYKYMSPQDKSEVEKDVVAYMKKKVISSSIYDSCQVYGIVKRNEYVEQIVKMKTEDANKLISMQIEHNKCGLFFREVIRPGSNVAKNIKEDSIILWSKDNRSLTELAGICRDAGDGQAFIVFRPGEQSSLGIRVMNGKIALVRARILKGDSLPNSESMSVKGRHGYIVDGLPEAFDPREVVTFFAKKGWFILQGNSKNLKPTQLRVLADQPPPSRIYPNVSTGKNIFIYEDGKKLKDLMTSGGDGEEEEKGKERQGEEEEMKMDWQPPNLFDEEDDKIKQGDQQSPAKQAPSNAPDAIRAVAVNSVTSSSSSSSSGRTTPAKEKVMEEKRMEEERKRMDAMEKEMLELKNKMTCLESSMMKNNEEINNKFNVLEQQQQAANVDIKSMFTQLMSEMGVIKTTMSTTMSTVPSEQERKKARVDSSAPLNA
jgi:hypothetical protein